MKEEHDSSQAQRPNATTMMRRTLSFDEIEAYCKTYHFTIFYGAVQEEELPQAVWNLEQNPRWED